MLEIKRRHGPDDFTTVVVYEDGEFRAAEPDDGEDADMERRRALADGYGGLEGMTEEAVMNSIDGPRHIAFRADEGEEGEGEANS